MTNRQYYASIRRAIIAAGHEPVKAVYSKAGNCIFCGEAGRCPGWHALRHVIASQKDPVSWKDEVWRHETS